MAIQEEVSFILRAKDLAATTMDGFGKRLDAIDKSQKAVVNSSELLSKSTKELEDEQKQLFAILDQLQKRLADVSKYEAQEDRLASLNKQLTEAKEAYTQFGLAFHKAVAGDDKDGIRQNEANLRATLTVIKEVNAELRKTETQQNTVAGRLQKGGLDPTRIGVARSQTEAVASQTVSLFNVASADIQRRAVAQKEAEQAEARELDLARQRAMVEKEAAQAERDAAQANAAYAAKAVEEERQAEAFRKEAAAAQERLTTFQERGLAAQRQANALGNQVNASVSASGRPTSGATAASGVRGVLDPLAESARSLDGAEKAVAGVVDQLSKIPGTAGPAADKLRALKQAGSDLGDIEKAIVSQAKLVDSYRRQEAELRRSQTAYNEAQAEVKQFADAISTAASIDVTLTEGLGRAQAQLNLTANAFRQQAEAVNRAQAALRQAGVDVNNLDNEEARLVETARRVSGAQKQVEDSTRQVGEASNKASSLIEKLTGGSRESLSVYQRVRGEVLALATSYIGLQAAIGAMSSTLDAVKTDQAVRAQITQTTESNAAAIKQYGFLRSEAERTGIAFESVARGYGQIARQSQEYGIKQETINQLFKDVLTSARALNQTPEQLDNTFRAIGQIFDKGTIQAEEFKNQLGDAGLAGLTPILAKTLKDQGVKSVSDLTKAMQNGQVAAVNIISVFRELAATSEKSFGENMKGYSAQLGIFNSQLYEIKLQFANSGFLEGVNEGLKALSDLLKDPQFQQALKELGSNVGDIIKTFVEWAADIDNLKLALDAFELYLAGKFILTIAGTSLKLTQLAAAMVEAGGAATGMSTAIGATGQLGLLGAAAALGLTLANVLLSIKPVREEFERIGSASVWDQIKRYGPLAGLTATTGFIGRTLGTGIGEINTGVSESDIDKRGEQAVATISQARIDAYRQKKQTDAIAAAFQRSAQSVTATGAADGVDPVAQADVALKKAQGAVDQAAKDAEKLQENTQKKSLKSQKDYLEYYKAVNKSALDNANRALDEARKTGDDALAEKAKTALDTINKGIQSQAEIAYSADAARAGKKAESAVEAFEKKRQSLHESTNAVIASSDAKLDELTSKVQSDSLEARLKVVDNAIEKQKAQIEVAIRQNEDLIERGKKLGQDTTDAASDVEKLRNSEKQLDLQKQVAEQLETQKYNSDQNEQAEKKINTQLQLRSALIDAVQAQQKAGSVGPLDAEKMIKAINTQTLDGDGGVFKQIDKQIESLDRQIDIEKEAGNASDDYTTKLELQRASLIKLQAATEESSASTSKFQTDMNKLVSQDVTNGIGQVASAIGDAAKGTKSWGDAWRGIGDTILNTIADILVGIAKLIIQQQILNALGQSSGSSSGGGGSIIGSLVGAIGSSFGGGDFGGSGSYFHEGGIVGAASNRTTNMPASVWASARRFHTGGFPGLEANEVAAIIKKNEEVLTEDDPRNALNPNRQQPVTQVGNAGDKMELHVHADAESFWTSGLATKGGARAFRLHLQANKNEFARLLGVKS